MAKKSNKKRNIIIGVVAGLLVLITVAIFLGNNRQKDIVVTTEKVSRKTIVQTVSAVGKIQPETEVKVSPETSGEIVQLNIKEGDTVKAGQMLVRIKPDIVESQLEQMKYSAEAVKSEIPVAKSNLEKAKADFKRAADLFAKKYISQEEYDRAKNVLDAAEAGVSSNGLRYEQAKASYRQTEKTAARTVIYAPISGIVTKLDVEKGEKVVGTEMMQGTEMLRVSDLSVMNAEVEVDENDITLVKIGDVAEVEIDAFPDKKFKAVVVEIGHSALLSATGTQDQVTNFKVKVRLLETNAKFRPGMSCNVEIKTETRDNVLAVPLQSVTEKRVNEDEKAKAEEKEAPKPEDEEENSKKTEKPSVYVFVLNGNKVKMVEVKTGLSDKGYIEVIEGVKEGDVVVSGSYFAIKKELEDGSIVKLDKADNTAKK